MSDIAVLIIALVGGWTVVSVAVPRLAALCVRHGWLDRPGPRKMHIRPTPRLTGIALFLSIWMLAAAAAVFLPSRMQEIHTHFLTVLVGGMAVLLLGVTDDLRPLSGGAKLLVQAAVGSFLYVNGVGFDRLWIPFVGGLDLGLFSWPITLLWFVVLVNVVNIIDGMDGLAVSTTAVATITLIWVSWTLRLPPVWIGAAGLLGGLIAFWRYNRPPASVFMGDSGSLSLGYFFAVVALWAPIKRFTAVAFFVPLIAFFVPLAEAALSLGRRSLAGANPLGADARHLHHRLQERGWSAQRILIAYNSVAVALGLFSISMLYFNRRVLAVALGIFVLSLLMALGIILSRPPKGCAGEHQPPADGEE